MRLLEHVRKLLEGLEGGDIHFRTHFLDRVIDRPVSKELVRECLQAKDRLIQAEQQPARRAGEQKFKLWFRLSNRYSLVVIVVVASGQVSVVTAWNTERKWHKG